MSRTPNASTWEHHEDELLYTVIKNSQQAGMPIYEAYRKASDTFKKIDTYTSREPNACRQRWAKIKGDTTLYDATLLKESGFEPDEYIPVTTGVQEEFNFDDPVTFDMPIIPNVVTNIASLEDQETNAPSYDVFPDLEDDYSEIDQQEEEVPVEQPTNLFRELESILARVEVRNLSLEAQNSNLKEELKSANNIIQRYEEELATFRQIRSLMQSGVN